MHPYVATATANTTTVDAWPATATTAAASFRVTLGDDDVSSGGGVREPRPTLPVAPAGAVALEVPRTREHAGG
jgi:hypothetical protein